MKIIRWMAPYSPATDQVRRLFDLEGLEPQEEILEPKAKVPEHRHPLSEIRIIVSGELLFNIAGNQFLMRAGDRVEIPSNTKHSHTNNGSEPCVSLYAQRSF